MGKNDEIKREAFIRVAEKRTEKIIEMIRLLGNCSSKNNYKYTQEDVDEIFSAIERELKNAQQKFKCEESSDKKFKLSNRNILNQ